ncbi:MAG: trypsin-like peptidase domain-containing protein [Clostridiales Family XIII bacterium]|jgi:S1-C subfamily serine protease|nr:trypsin-like peptidase domain-containing protein [Clostridiales Family XIII bacterium]
MRQYNFDPYTGEPIANNQTPEEASTEAQVAAEPVVEAQATEMHAAEAQASVAQASQASDATNPYAEQLHAAQDDVAAAYADHQNEVEHNDEVHQNEAPAQPFSYRDYTAPTTEPSYSYGPGVTYNKAPDTSQQYAASDNHYGALQGNAYGAPRNDSYYSYDSYDTPQGNAPNTSYNSYHANDGGAAVAKPKKQRNPKATFAVVLVIVCLVSSVAASAITGMVMNGNTYHGSGNNSINIKTGTDVDVTEAVAKKVGPAVVGITSTVTSEGGGGFFGIEPQESTGVGTGMVVDKNGYILTNSHVVLDGDVDSIVVSLADGQELAGKLIWNDSSIDLAIVKVDAKNLPTVDMGNSDDISIGSYVAAIGNPLGLQFNGSITSGVVSGLGRSIQASDGNKSVQMDDLIQVDAAINSGNSGGPLLNKNGQVIGINTAKTSNAEGMGFAIPINTAKPIIEQVIDHGSFERVYLGISVTSVDTMKKNYPNIKIDADHGAYVQAVSEDSPAGLAGLKVGDVITKIEGKELETSSALIKSLLGYKPGDKVKLEVQRDGSTIELDVSLASQDSITS